MPLAGPSLATTAIFSFNYSWNEFLYALILTGQRTKTVPLGVYNWVSYEEINWGGLTATAILALIPFFAIGAWILMKVDVGEGQRAARAAEDQWAG